MADPLPDHRSRIAARYNFRIGVQSHWTPTPPCISVHRGTGVTLAEGVNEGESRVTWEIEQVQDSCRLTVIHDQLREGANDHLFGGWPMVLSGLKTLLETGEQLTRPARCNTQTPNRTRRFRPDRVLIRPQDAANRSP